MSTTNPPVTTEWEDLQIKYGNYAPRKQVVRNEAKSQELIKSAEEANWLSRLELGDLEEEVGILRDIGEVEEATELDLYRRRTLQRLKTEARLNRFGRLIHLPKDGFVQEVTDASKECIIIEDEDDESARISKTIEVGDRAGTYVIVHMYNDGIELCRKLNDIFGTLASKFKAIKFTKAIASDIIPDYPIKNCPTVLLYYGGICLKQIVGANIWGGSRMTADRVEYVLGTTFHILETDIEAPEDSQNGSGVRFHISSNVASSYPSLVFSPNARHRKSANSKEDYCSDDNLHPREYSSNKLSQIAQRGF